jgi:hypothetical protein
VQGQESRRDAEHKGNLTTLLLYLTPHSSLRTISLSANPSPSPIFSLSANPSPSPILPASLPSPSPISSASLPSPSPILPASLPSPSPISSASLPSLSPISSASLPSPYHLTCIPPISLPCHTACLMPYPHLSPSHLQQVNSLLKIATRY